MKKEKRKIDKSNKENELRIGHRYRVVQRAHMHTHTWLYAHGVRLMIRVMKSRGPGVQPVSPRARVA